MVSLSTTAMVLAAGLGTRMRPLTLTTPKPLLKVGGRTMLDHALDRLKEQGISRVVVNSFYLADQIEAALAQRTDLDIVLSRETDLLDTGGGVLNVLCHFDDRPFFVLNADLPWLDQGPPALARMASFWDDSKMDALLLVMRRDRALGFGERGDYNLDPDGRLHRLGQQPPFPYVMISAQIMHPKLYAGMADRVFSNSILWNKAEQAGRLYGLAHEGTCYHVGTPADWEDANQRLADGRGWG